MTISATLLAPLLKYSCFFLFSVSATAYCSIEGKWNFSKVNFRASCTRLSEAQAYEVAKALLKNSSEQVSATPVIKSQNIFVVPKAIGCAI